MKDEINPQSRALSKEARAKQARGAVRENPRIHVKAADPGQVVAVCNRISEQRLGIEAACGRTGIRVAAFWRTVHRSPELRDMLACALVSRALDVTLATAASPAGASAYSKTALHVASNLSPGAFGNVSEARPVSLVINTNLTLAVGAEGGERGQPLVDLRADQAGNFNGALSRLRLEPAEAGDEEDKEAD